MLELRRGSDFAVDVVPVATEVVTSMSSSVTVAFFEVPVDLGLGDRAGAVFLFVTTLLP